MDFKVCHSSAFQTISVGSVYIIIIKYSDSILGNLNNTMQTKHHATKIHTHIQTETRLTRDYFLWWKDQKMFEIFRVFFKIR